jgi:hypothetical protein
MEEQLYERETNLFAETVDAYWDADGCDIDWQNDPRVLEATRIFEGLMATAQAEPEVWEEWISPLSSFLSNCYIAVKCLFSLDFCAYNSFFFGL